MLVILHGENSEALTKDLSARADFVLADSPVDDTLDALLAGEIGAYSPNTGAHVLAIDHHWKDAKYPPDNVFKYIEMFLASRGGVTVVSEASDLYSDSITGVVSTEEDGVLVTRLARLSETEATRLARWKHYIGDTRPITLIVCRPDRKTRLRVIDGYADDEWQEIGIASSVSSIPELNLLHEALGDPEVIGVGQLPGHTENWIESIGGTFQT